MLTTPQLHQLAKPVFERSVYGNIMGFSDRAATYVLERLGMNINTHFATAQNSHQNLQRLRATQWIDHKVKRFFEHNPQGQGLEISSGLSTRFHRISSQLDWPRFTWQMINPCDIDDCIHFVFPKLDNFRSLASRHPINFLPTCLGWQGATSNIVIIGENQPLTQQHIQSNLIPTLKTLAAGKIKALECIICYSDCSLKKLLQHQAFSMLVVDEYQPPKHRPYWLQALRRFITIKQKQTVNLSHVKFYF